MASLRPPGYPPLSPLRTASCNSPLVATALPPCGPGVPSRLGERAAGLAHQDVERRQVPQRHLGFGGDVDRALGEQAVRAEVAVGAYPPHRVGEFDEAVAQPQRRPARQARERQARRLRGRSTEDTEMRRARHRANDVNAPSPRAGPPSALQRGRADHSDDGTPSCSSAINVAHTGTPRTKFLVPSIGSITHCLPLKVVVPPNSSPSTGSSGRSRDSVVAQRLTRPTGRRR